MHFYVIGIGNKSKALTEEQQALVQQQRVFSGGERHYELVKALLPPDHQWIPIKSPLEAVFHAYENTPESVLVFASGNPLFYGFSNTLRKKYPQATIHTYPSFSSTQLLANGAGLNSNELRTVSVHGRSWQGLDEAIIKQEPLIGVLTDQEKSPSAIAERLLYFGYDNYDVLVGEDLEGEQERIRELSLKEVANKEFHPLNCLILRKKGNRNIPFGIPDHYFKGLEGRPNMITKMPLRLCALHALDLPGKSVLWDIGFCTGALSIEARLRFPQLSIHAFEKRMECEQIMEQNQQLFGAPGIVSHMGDIFEAELEMLPKPNAVFVGGHGGRLGTLLKRVGRCLGAGGVVVINAVQESSIQTFSSTAKELGWKTADPLSLKVNSHNEITILKAIKEN